MRSGRALAHDLLLLLADPCGRRGAGEVIDDSVLTSKVKLALIDDPVTKAHQVNVETQKGVVQLTGFVDSTAAKARAAELARSVEGVTAVRNDLEIRQR